MGKITLVMMDFKTLIFHPMFNTLRLCNPDYVRVTA